MAVSLLIPEAIENHKAFFIGRNEPNYSWATAVSSGLFFPGVTGFWPGSIQGNGVTPDLTGNGQTMTLNTVTLTNIGMAPCFSIPNTTSYLNTADGVLNSPTSVFFFSCWVRFTSLGADQGIINKWGAAGNRSFRLYKTSANVLSLSISSNGTSSTTITALAGTALVTDTWYNVAVVLRSDTSATVWLNGAVVIAGIFVAVFDGTADLELGRASNGGSDGLRGYMSLPVFGLYELPEIYFNTHYQYTKALYGYN